MIHDGTLEKTIKETAERWRPEAMYFTAIDGKRTAFIMVDLPDTSDIPAYAEPFFDRIGADVKLYPVMDQESLSKGLGKLAQQ